MISLYVNFLLVQAGPQRARRQTHPPGRGSEEVDLVTFLLAAIGIAAASPDAVVGQWRTETRNAIVDIHRCGASLCGRLLTSDGLRADPTLRDVNNRDPALRGRLLKGMTLLADFSFADGVWDDGAVYDASDGRTYRARITPVDRDHLKLRGCVFVPLCKTQTWTRVR